MMLYDVDPIFMMDSAHVPLLGEELSLHVKEMLVTFILEASLGPIKACKILIKLFCNFVYFSNHWSVYIKRI